MTAVADHGGVTDSGRLIIVRHGQTEWSLAGRHTGRTDVPLTAHGEAQARQLVGTLPTARVAAVLVSPLRRAMRTAELAQVPAAQVDDDLVEWDYGDYEGLTRDEIREHDPDWTIWTGSTPGGETPEQVIERADRVLVRVRAALPAGDVVVVGHGHFSRVLATQWLGVPMVVAAVLFLEAASPSVLGDDRGQPVIVHWNIPNAAGITG